VTVRTSVSSVGIIGTGGGFSGWRNYAAVLSSPLFHDASVRSLEWVVGNAVLQTALAFVAALVLNEKLRGRTFARTWIVVSWVVPTVVIAIIGRWMLNGAVGVMQYLLLTTHLK
jgi:multiple sugar transport system permease protein